MPILTPLLFLVQHLQKEASFFTRFEEVLKIIDFFWIRYDSLRPF